MNTKEVKKALNMNKGKAAKIANDQDELEKFLNDIEEKLKVIPQVGDLLSDIPLLISLINSYYKKEYTIVPLGTIIGIISALLYVIAPIDLIPDSIPIAGYVDDALVVSACVKLVESDLQDYKKWKENKY